MTSGLRQYSSGDEHFENAKRIVTELSKEDSGFKIDPDTGAFSIDGEKHEDSIIDVALTLSRPVKRNQKKKPPVTMKNFASVARALSQKHFPSFMITNRDRLKDYNRIYETMHDKDFGRRGDTFVDWPKRVR